MTGMPIVVQLDVMLARRKVRSKELAEHVGITAVSYTHLTLPTNREV